MSSKRLTSQPDLTIIIPAYREGKRIGRTLDELAIFLREEKTLSNKSVEILVVSATSTDNTDHIVLEKKNKFKELRLLKPGPKVGKGRDVRFGMLRARGKAIMFMDADMATPLRHLPHAHGLYSQGADVVIATRNLRKHHPNVIRRALSNAGNLLFRVAGGVWVEDSQCGFKLFSYEAAQICFSKLTIMGWGFDMEVLAIARANKLSIRSFRINDWTSVPEGSFTESMIKNSLNSLKELLLILTNRVRGIYRN